MNLEEHHLLQYSPEIFLYLKEWLKDPWFHIQCITSEMTVGVRNLSSELNFVTGHQGLLRSLTDWKLCDHWKWEHSYLHTPLCLMHGCIFIQIGETHPFENHQLIFVGLFFIQICLLVRLGPTARWLLCWESMAGARGARCLLNNGAVIRWLKVLVKPAQRVLQA